MSALVLIKTIPRGNILSMLDEDNKRRILAFRKEYDATKCINYISEFRHHYGYWPEMNLTATRQRIHTGIDFKKRSVQDIEKFFYLDYIEDVDSFCTTNSSSFFVCHNFHYSWNDENEMQLMFSAQHLDCNPDMYRYRRALDDMFNDG